MKTREGVLVGSSLTGCRWCFSSEVPGLMKVFSNRMERCFSLKVFEGYRCE